MDIKLYKYKDYIEFLGKEGLLVSSDGVDSESEVSLVSCDSRNVTPGTLFICKGAHFKEEFLISAMEKGATVYLAEKKADKDYPCIIVNDIRRAMAYLADFYYGHPSGTLPVVGITGTKGKSSTAYYLKYIFDEYMKAQGGVETGVIGSIDTYDGVERFESHLTTPEPLDLERHFANAISAGMSYLTMEVSSQALKYDRVDRVELAAAVFLNIGQDHISPVEHPDFEDYFASKLKIFDHSRIACVNLDMEHADRVLEAAREKCERVITFSENDENADIYAASVHKDRNDIVFRVRTPHYRREMRLTMPGLFNVQNALAALSVCEALSIPDQYAYAGLMKARVPGRMEVYSNSDERVTVIVDYAHNRMSFETLFGSVKKEYPGRRIISIFGCPGKKAYDRREDLGDVAGKYSDLVILTEEDAGEEPVMDICRDIAKYVEAHGTDYSIAVDRGEAIRQAVMGVDTPTVILLTGKGAETRQKRGIEYIDVPSDVEYTKKFLHEYDVQHGMDGMSTVRSLLSVLPALRKYSGSTIVIKYGGSAVGLDQADTILEDAAALQSVGVRIVIVHGGGKDISELSKRLGIETKFENGYRVTDEESLGAAEMALSAEVNKSIVASLQRFGARACGISGRDGSLITASVKDEKLGLVGKVSRVDTSVIEALLDAGFLPVVSPIARARDASALNCNADDAARAIAEALRADKLVFLTDKDGILVDSSNEATRIGRLDAKRARELVDAGLIEGGMIPKTMNCIHAVESGVRSVTVLDGRMEHAVLLDAITGMNLGTTIYSDSAGTDK